MCAHPARSLAALVCAVACSGSPSPEGSLSQNVGDAFAPCNEAEIRFLATKHNFMTAFRPCGNNHFQDFAWSPDGRKLYFQLGASHLIMDAEAPGKDTRVVPTPSPIGPGGWLTRTQLVVPVGPKAGEEGGPQLALFDTEQATVFQVALPATWTEIADVQPSGTPSEVLLTAKVGEARQAFRVSLTEGSHEPAFPWLTEVTTLSYTPAQKLAVIGHEGTVTLREAATGKSRGSWRPALRGSLHDDGRWLMLEHEGEAVSVFYQRAWDELSERARERELARAKQFEDRLPDSFETEVKPPTLSFVDVPTGKRYRIRSVQGRNFQWYGPTPHYGSFMLWGFEGKQFKRNVLLGDFTSRMTMVAAGSTYLGVEAFGEEQGAHHTPPATPPATPAPSPSDADGAAADGAPAER